MNTRKRFKYICLSLLAVVSLIGCSDAGTENEGTTSVRDYSKYTDSQLQSAPELEVARKIARDRGTGENNLNFVENGCFDMTEKDFVDTFNYYFSSEVFEMTRTEEKVGKRNIYKIHDKKENYDFLAALATNDKKDQFTAVAANIEEADNEAHLNSMVGFLYGSGYILDSQIRKNQKKVENSLAKYHSCKTKNIEINIEDTSASNRGITGWVIPKDTTEDETAKDIFGTYWDNRGGTLISEPESDYDDNDEYNDDYDDNDEYNDDVDNAYDATLRNTELGYVLLYETKDDMDRYLNALANHDEGTREEMLFDGSANHIQNGTECNIISEHSSYAEVELSDGSYGYVVIEDLHRTRD